MTLISKKRAILFADVTDSTRIYELHGDKRAARSIDACIGELARIVAAHNGTVVKTIGDEIMAAFSDVDSACRASHDMQAAVSVMQPVEGIQHAIRVGFHHGDVLASENDFWGDAVNTASRVTELARPGQILTTAVTVDSMSEALRMQTRDLDAHNIKGKKDPVRVFEVQWADDVDSTRVVTLVSQPTTPTKIGTLVYAGNTFEISTNDPNEQNPLWLGRDTRCELIVPESTASRRHARIERRGAQVYLVDDSTNGTYVRVGRNADVHLRRESMLLLGSGKITLGTPTDLAIEVVRFEI